MDRDLADKLGAITAAIAVQTIRTEEFLRLFERHVIVDDENHKSIMQLMIEAKVTTKIQEERIAQHRELIDELRKNQMVISDLKRELVDVRATLQVMHELTAARRGAAKWIVIGLSTLATVMGTLATWLALRAH